VPLGHSISTDVTEVSLPKPKVSARSLAEPVAGFNATYPTFLYGDLVVKLFGYLQPWRGSHAAERAAQALDRVYNRLLYWAYLKFIGNRA